MKPDDGDLIEERLRLLARLEEAIRTMRGILEPASKGSPLEAERGMKSFPNAFEDLDSLASQATDLHSWRLIREELELRAATARMEFGTRLEEAFGQQGVEWSGAFPVYKVWGSVRVEVDPVRGEVRVGRRSLPLSDVREIAQQLLARGSRAASAPTAEFQTRLSTAYQAAADAAKASPGDYVSIGKVYEALRKSMPRGYTRERFARDLSKLDAEAHGVEFAASRHPRHGIRVPPGDGILVGSLRIRS